MVEDRVSARKTGNFILARREDVEYVDVSPKQLVSVAASLIPFLENDDANRALMGSNMQRQAVPLLRSEAPVVGTGMEHITVKDSGAAVVCRRAGTVDSVDSRRIIVRVEAQDGPDKGKEIGADIYNLTKFKCSNQNTSINQKPIVKVGQHVAKGQILGDGPCTDMGELALGRNVLVAFMPWRGYNFEDAILVSEKLVKEDMYTSIHIEEFEIEARDTKLGPEEVTRDIPNVSESLLNNLDESGIIRIGASVKPGDILVGKVTPKGETQLTPEEKLLRAIFGEKAGDVRDASLVCPPGIEGIVVDVKIFSRKGVEKDDRAKQIEDDELFRMEKDLKDEIRILQDERDKRILDLLEDKTSQVDLLNARGDKVIRKGQKLERDVLEKLRHSDILKLHVRGKDDEEVEEELNEIVDKTERQIEVLKALFAEKESRLKRGDELPPGVIKLVKVFVAMKRKLSVGDKMAGRHGNKGVLARILPEEDMPYLPDGTPVEIVLNPLGVPSRMNVGQILETHLGWAARALGLHFATPVFDGAQEGEIKKLLGQANTAEEKRNPLRPNLLQQRQDQPHRRPDRGALRAEGHRGLHLHAEAQPPRGRQDPRALHRPLLPHHPAAPGRQGPVRRPALRGDGGLGARGLRGGAHPAGALDREVGRRLRAGQDLRGHREGRHHLHPGPARVVQRAHPGAAEPVPGRRADQDQTLRPQPQRHERAQSVMWMDLTDAREQRGPEGEVMVPLGVLCDLCGFRFEANNK